MQAVTFTEIPMETWDALTGALHAFFVGLVSIVKWTVLLLA